MIDIYPLIKNSQRSKINFTCVGKKPRKPLRISSKLAPNIRKPGTVRKQKRFVQNQLVKSSKSTELFRTETALYAQRIGVDSHIDISFVSRTILHDCW